MNVKRFTGRTSREAMQKVRQVFGDEAVVLSTKPAAEGGVEIMAMGADGMAAIDRLEAEHHEPQEPVAAKVAAKPAAARGLAARAEADAPAARATAADKSARGSVASLASSVQDDVRQLAMSTLSFQEYVRERMLKRRQAALKARMEPEMAQSPEEQLAQRVAPAAPRASDLLPSVALPESDLDLSGPALRLVKNQREAQAAEAAQAARDALIARPTQAAAQAPQPRATARAAAASAGWTDDDLRMDNMVKRAAPAKAAMPVADEAAREALVAAQTANASMLSELREMRALMKERFETMAFVDKLQRTPSQALMAQRLLDGGFSPVLIRKMLDGMPRDVIAGKVDETSWSAQVLQRNLNTADHEPNIEDQGGVFALIGSTGVGKTTTTAKLAALFAAKHGAHNLGLITLDAYRMGAHEQLRAYGRILGVPVHIAHDRAALEDLLELLSGKKLILIDTAGMPQRDARTRELLEMVSHQSIKKLLVINTAAQGDAIEDVMVSYQAASCAGIVLSKLDEAVKLGPALDALIRHKLKVLGVANGQRVPEDWHRLSAASLVHRALRASLNPAYRLDASEVSLVFAAPATFDAPSSSQHMV
ncbi:flagellar biosynthesis protein FlhF [Aquabacterium soli]|uniref:Flagellar biosynthesis protein FlhF n=1 Tax=Aquabacterium soli TaxID=2493092 RepID=A0A3R8S3G8_9BURK|nr:flagellar biosynthesis protein FlhF [Aquabacterium soli]RRS05163.1 flagellar biosynthesis protein FlhF [Aquabacterium soli]